MDSGWHLVICECLRCKTHHSVSNPELADSDLHHPRSQINIILELNHPIQIISLCWPESESFIKHHPPQGITMCNRILGCGQLGDSSFLDLKPLRTRTSRAATAKSGMLTFPQLRFHSVCHTFFKGNPHPMGDYTNGISFCFAMFRHLSSDAKLKSR